MRAGPEAGQVKQPQEQAEQSGQDEGIDPACSSSRTEERLGFAPDSVSARRGVHEEAMKKFAN